MKNLENALCLTFVIIIIIDYVLTTAPYRVLYLEEPDLCSEITKRKVRLDHGPKALVVKQRRLNNHRLPWNANFNCRFSVESSRRNDGIVIVLQYISLRKNETTGECIDYVQFKGRNGRTSQKFCGRFNAELIMDSIFGVASKKEAVNNTFVEAEGELTTYIFISKEALHEEEDLDLYIVYTTYKPCRFSPPSYKPCLEHYGDICMFQEYFGDNVINCPYVDCVDEGGCAQKELDDVTPSVGNKVLIASITSLLAVFIIFIWCLCICRKYEKLCWAPQFATSNAQPQSARVIEMSESPNQSQNVIQGAAHSSTENQEDKDLPPSYDSLFPSRSTMLPHLFLFVRDVTHVIRIWKELKDSCTYSINHMLSIGEVFFFSSLRFISFTTTLVF